MKLFEQHAALCRKVVGHYAYYGITGNFVSIKNYHYHVGRIWQNGWAEDHGEISSTGKECEIECLVIIHYQNQESQSPGRSEPMISRNRVH